VKEGDLQGKEGCSNPKPQKKPIEHPERSDYEKKIAIWKSDSTKKLGFKKHSCQNRGGKGIVIQPTMGKERPQRGHTHKTIRGVFQKKTYSPPAHRIRKSFKNGRRCDKRRILEKKGGRKKPTDLPGKKGPRRSNGAGPAAIHRALQT